MNDIDTTLTNHFRTRAELAQPMPDINAVAHGQPRLTMPMNEPKESTRRRLLAAAAVVLIAGVGGLFWAQSTRNEPATSEQPELPNTPAPASSPTSRQLASAEEFGPTDWLVATVLPEGVSWVFALEPTEPLGTIRRSTHYEDISEQPGGPSLSVTLTDQRGADGARSEEVAGVSWRVDDTDSGSFWGAEAEVGGEYVQVQASGRFDPAVLAGLEVVDRSELPPVPLGDRSQAVRVATASTGQTAYYEVQQSGDHYCFWTSNESGSGGGCATVIDPDAIVTIDGGTRDTAYGATSSTVAIAGSASTEVDRVEVEFVDGTLSEATPTDLSGQFDRHFWIISTAIEHPAAGSDGPPASAGNVREVRAYSQTGELLDAVRPGDPGSGAFGNF